MDPIHPAFAFGDPLFYDRTRRAETGRAYRVPEHLLWDQWRCVEDERWSHWGPPSGTLPEQGWKVHISAVPRTATTVLQAAAEYCHGAGLHFKYLRDDVDLAAALAKDADRSSAGKFITIYPDSVDRLLDCLTRLDEQLGGLPGAYILSDLRWNSGPLHVRYGAFTLQWVHSDDDRVPAIRDLDRDLLVPDVRSATFVVPPWVRMPAFLQEQLSRLHVVAPRWFPRVTQLVQHSNSGGVYAAIVDDREVILKEARPHTGYTPDHRDAVARLHAEESTLLGLPAAARAPRVVTSFDLHNHRFLVTERAPGRPLSRVVAATNPLGGRHAGPDAIAKYRSWALRVGQQLRDSIDTLHDAGHTHGDLHPGNVLVDDTGSITVIDFEMSQLTDASDATQFGVPGFVALRTQDPVQRDLFAVACIELHMFLPLTPLLPLDPLKAEDLTSIATSVFDLPTEWAASVKVRLKPGLPHATMRGQMPEHTTVENVARGLLRDATPSRQDRLWPGDPRQFREEPFGLAHGALGVAVALRSANVPVPSEVREWIEGSITKRRIDPAIGLMDGLAGAVWGCRRLGWNDLADDLLADLSDRSVDLVGPDLYSGTSGIALIFLHESQRFPELRDRAVDLIERAADQWRLAERRVAVTAGRGGLMRGGSGLALASLHAYAVIRSSSFIDIAREGLERDLITLVETPDATLHVNEGWRTLPYLGSGSAGIGLTLAHYIRATGDTSTYAGTLTKIIAAACAPFAAQVGLFNGRAGLVGFLREVERLGFGSPETAAAVATHIDQLRLHALHRDGVTRFAGDGLLRASCDLATGAAGVLGALVDRLVLPLSPPPVGESVTEPSEGGEIHGVSTFASSTRTL